VFVINNYLKMTLLACLLSSVLCAADKMQAVQHDSISAYAINSRTHEVLLDEQSDLSLVPASCMKVVTTAAALQVLGPDMRFQTDLEYDGSIDAAGVLHGNLYIRGGGDPCLGSGRVLPALAWPQQIEAWVAAIVKQGIRSIEGTIIGDATRWESALAAPSWLWEDLGNYYGAGASALSFNENAYTLFFKPGSKEGAEATILRQEPPLATVKLVNEVKTGPLYSGDKACIYGAEYSPVQFIRGTIPLGVKEFAIKGAMSDPAASCADLLTKALESRGGVVGRAPMRNQQPRVVFHTTLSPPVKDIVYWTNQKSINLYAEHLLKKMGEVAKQEGSTQAGTQAVTAFWAGQGIDLQGFYMADGSGLSRKNCITAKQLVAILLKMKESPHFALFLKSLPEKRNYKAKHGSMSQIRGLTGYIDDTVFAVLINHSTDSKLEERIDAILAAATKPGNKQ